MTTWEAIFAQSRVNDGYYSEDELPQRSWEWPTATWFRARLDEVREHETTGVWRTHHKAARKAAAEMH